jgi:Leucine-rich repeat (LRR) protein
MQLENLSFLILAHNQLSGCNMKKLVNLSLLDLEGNAIQDMSKLMLPKNLDYLILRENPVEKIFDYRLQAISLVDELIELDEKGIDSMERRIARMNAKYVSLSNSVLVKQAQLWSLMMKKGKKWRIQI